MDERQYDLAAAIKPWVPTIRAFVNGHMTVEQFKPYFVAEWHSYCAEFPGAADHVFEVIERMYADVDYFYFADPALRDEPMDLGPDELRQRFRDVLRKAGYAERPAPPPKSRAAEQPAVS